MIYQWKCGECGEVTDITRVMDDRQLGPSENEAACGCGCVHYYRILSPPNSDFETMRDKGILERLPMF